MGAPMPTFAPSMLPRFVPAVLFFFLNARLHMDGVVRVQSGLFCPVFDHIWRVHGFHNLRLYLSEPSPHVSGKGGAGFFVAQLIGGCLQLLIVRRAEACRSASEATAAIWFCYIFNQLAWALYRLSVSLCTRVCARSREVEVLIGERQNSRH